MTDEPLESMGTAKLRVCFLLDSFYPVVGGGEIHARLLSAKMLAAGVETFVLTQKRMKGLASFEKIDEVPVYRVWPEGLIRFGKYWMQLPAFFFLIKYRCDFDLVYVCGLRALGPMAVFTSKLLGKACILRSESCDEMQGNHIIEKSGFLKPLARLLIKLKNRLLSQADGFIAISSVIEREFTECGVPREKIALISNGIELSKFVPVDSEEKSALREQLNLRMKKVFCYTGKLNQGKGLELLLRAWERITRDHADVHLLLVGGGDNQFLGCEVELKKFVSEANLHQTVTFTGYTTNVVEYLRMSDFFVLPSESEALGISLLEAMACELASIGTAAGGIVDILDNGKNGLLININDEDGLFIAMSSLLSDENAAQRLGKAGAETVRKRYGIEKVTEQHIHYFKSIRRA